MRREKILAMKPGRKLNILVAEEIMECSVIEDKILGDVEVYANKEGEILYQLLLPYSENIAAAHKIVAKMLKQGHDEAEYWKNDDRPDVICRASLLAIFNKKNINGNKKKTHLRVVK